MNLNDDIIQEMENLNFTEEQRSFIQEKLIKSLNRDNGYKIRTGTPYVVFKQYFKDYVFYKIPVYSKDVEGKDRKAYKDIQFVNCEPIKEDKDRIIIKSFFEDFYFKKDNHYQPQWILKILDYEYADNPVKEQRQNDEALEQYNNELNYDFDDLPF